MVYFALYLNLMTDFVRILDCYVAIVFPFAHQIIVTQKNSFAFGVLCWFLALGVSAIFYFTELSRSNINIFLKTEAESLFKKIKSIV